MLNDVTADISDLPEVDLDIFDPEVMEEPWPAYRWIRSLGPVVYLRRLGVYAVARFQENQQLLKQLGAFRSGDGVAFNDAMNAAQAQTILGTDPPDHTILRSVLTPLLSSRALACHQAMIKAAAADLVDACMGKGVIDVVADLASHLPMSVGLDILGLPREGRRRHLLAAEMNFNAYAPLTPKVASDLQRLDIYGRKMAEVAENLAPNSVGYHVMAAAAAGRITQIQALGILKSLIMGSLHTTVNSISSTLYCLCTNPDSWDEIRSDRSLISNAYDESLRLEGPTLAVSRTAASNTVFAGRNFGAGARFALLFASANRDEARWQRPDEFVLRRSDARDQLTFGHGVHFCIGHILARMQSHALIEALADRVTRLELAAAPRRLTGGVVRGFERLPILLHGA